MPIGKIKDGLADIVIDTRYNKVVGSQATGGEGCIKFINDGQAIRRVFTSSAWVDGGAGNYYVEVPHTFNSSALTYVLQRDEGAGVWHYMADDEIEVDVDDDKFVLRTISPSVYAHIVRIVATGVVVDVV